MFGTFANAELPSATTSTPAGGTTQFASASDSVTVVSSGAAVAILSGAGTDALTVTSTGAAGGVQLASATDSFSVVSSGSAVLIAAGAGSDSLTVDETAAGRRVALGAATDTVAFTGSATAATGTGNVQLASANDTFTLSSSGAAVIKARAAGADTVTYTGLSTAVITARGAGADVLLFDLGGSATATILWTPVTPQPGAWTRAGTPAYRALGAFPLDTGALQ